jgi:hypothetical protein
MTVQDDFLKVRINASKAVINAYLNPEKKVIPNETT